MMGIRVSRQIVWWRSFLRRWMAHRHTDTAAALVFYCLISLVPILLAGVTFAGWVLGERAAHGELERQLTAVVGPEAAQFLESVLLSARLTNKDPIAFGLVMVTMLYAGSHVLSKLREALNTVNEVEARDPTRPIVQRVLARAVCAGLLLLFGILLIFVTLFEGFVGMFASRFEALDVPLLAKLPLLKAYEMVSTTLLLVMLFTMILKLLPRRRPQWRHALVGGALSALAVGSLKTGLDWYLRQSPLASVFGTGITVLVFLFWLFLAIQTFLAGAEITAFLNRRYGVLPRKTTRKPSNHSGTHSSAKT